MVVEEQFDLIVLGLLAVLLLLALAFVRLGPPDGAMREIGLAIIGGVVVGAAVLGLQVAVEDELEELTTSNRQQTSLSVREMAGDDPKVEGDASDLAGQDLSRLELDAIDLSGEVLEGTDLSDTELENADLTDADLTDADLAGSNLAGSNLEGADLTGADLSGADLTDANLRGATCPDGFVTETTCDGHLQP